MQDSHTRSLRTGAFEVAYTLRNTETGASYGPELVYSKLLSRQWPNPGKLRKTIGHSLQPYATLIRCQYHQLIFELLRVGIACCIENTDLFLNINIFYTFKLCPALRAIVCVRVAGWVAALVRE